MPESWYIVIYADTGEAYSVGTDIADPMPAQFVALHLSDADALAINMGRGYWDAARRAVVMRPESEWPAPPQ